MFKSFRGHQTHTGGCHVTAGRLIDEWFHLLVYCQGQPDRKQFKLMHDAWAKRWARLPYDVQGYITEQIHRRLLR